MHQIILYIKDTFYVLVSTLFIYSEIKSEETG